MTSTRMPPRGVEVPQLSHCAIVKWVYPVRPFMAFGASAAKLLVPVIQLPTKSAVLADVTILLGLIPSTTLRQDGL
jgi:hypothetical protein